MTTILDRILETKRAEVIARKGLATLDDTTVLENFTFGDTPRALAATPDGSRVYAAAHASGNRTTTVHDAFVPDGDEATVEADRTTSTSA